MKNINYNEIPCIMTRKEMCEILRISKPTALKMLRDREIESFTIGGNYRVTRESLCDYIKNSVYA